jgi:hypothetical protein
MGAPIPVVEGRLLWAFYRCSIIVHEKNIVRHIELPNVGNKGTSKLSHQHVCFESKADAVVFMADVRLLSARREWPRDCGPNKPFDEIAPPH